MSIDENVMNNIISSEVLLKEMSETETHPEVQITVINILPLKYFADCRIKDSINIEVDKIPDRVEDWDRTKFIRVYAQ